MKIKKMPLPKEEVNKRKTGKPWASAKPNGEATACPIAQKYTFLKEPDKEMHEFDVKEVMRANLNDTIQLQKMFFMAVEMLSKPIIKK